MSVALRNISGQAASLYIQMFNEVGYNVLKQIASLGCASSLFVKKVLRADETTSILVLGVDRFTKRSSRATTFVLKKKRNSSRALNLRLHHDTSHLSFSGG